MNEAYRFLRGMVHVQYNLKNIFRKLPSLLIIIIIVILDENHKFRHVDFKT